MAGHDMAAMGDSASGMAGMDHGAMTGMDHANAATDPPGEMAAMDHSGMAGGAPAAGGVAGMDHAAMGQQPLAPTTPDAMTGMDHANMPGMAEAPDAEAAVQRMLADPVIRDRIRTDPMLQPMVEAIAGPAGTGPVAAGAMDHGAMAGMDHGTAGDVATMDHAAMPGMGGVAATADERLRALATKLLLDPAVQARVQTDPALRALWADTSVRRFMGATPQ